MVRDNYYEDIDRDLYLQIYLDMYTQQRDNFLNGYNCDLRNTDAQESYHNLNFDIYRNNMYFVKWIDRKTEIEELRNTPSEERVYRIAKGVF